MRNPIKDYVKNYLRKILIEILEEPDLAPVYSKLKQIKISKDKKSIYSVIMNFPISTYAISISYSDPDSSAHQDFKIEVQSLNELKHELDNFEPEFKYFKEVHFSTEYVHPILGEQRAYEFLVLGSGDIVYSSSELSTIFKSLTEWMNNVPELLI